MQKAKVSGSRQCSSSQHGRHRHTGKGGGGVGVVGGVVGRWGWVVCGGGVGCVCKIGVVEGGVVKVVVGKIRSQVSIDTVRLRPAAS